ncbi:endoplasmic reticulum oxidoreductin-1-like protein [Nomia melanderi]|uniref:endoplasmic reticulum oxidoreductin-1-like protein n=1 Tax=Nomia melanderi TaxID=2448451 RepID=UPI0013046F91|nr:ero1-like protein [Nomia melanderi]XP_031839575.1 ero1-like protein [Nomia melanderi]XP_031839576.1 ero1-like protein [Nomia melanderi]XP_031839577.1 ero1-like protein [Nomia melanderi]
MTVRPSENMFILLMLFTALIPSVVHSNYFGLNSEKNDQCFCKLKGSIDDCSCNVDTVDYFNNMKIYPRLQSLLVRDYFRFYKVNLKQECPFWPDDSKCAMRYCSVQPCQDEDIPDGLKGDMLKHIHFNESPVDKYKFSTQYDNCLHSAKDHNKELGYLNTTISSENYKDFELWQQYDDAQDNFCVKESSPGEYVDLLLNPERYTGYRGSSAHRIWRSIYMENCFRPENSPHNFIQSSKINGMCLEKRVFYRVISGLHASINIHLCSKYLLSSTDSLGILPTGGQWGPNLDEFKNRFSPETTGGEGPNWLKNLYFIYLLELRAVAKAAPYLEREEYYTGNKVQDNDTRLAINDILSVAKSFPEHFNESVMFTGGAEAKLLKEQFKQHFRNISRIMDCVGCDKCKLWGKLQIQGLGTALKILFSGKFDKWEPTLHNFHRKQFFLERSEIVALINALGRLSESIYELDRFRQMLR